MAATVLTKVSRINPTFVNGAMLAYICISLFATQSWLTGFPQGHHGWVSVHSLANAGHTTSETYFGGYTIKHQPNGSEPTYEYFSRTPLPGRVIIGLPIRIFSRLENQVMASRMFNNLLVLLCIGIAFRVLTRAGFSTHVTLSACLLGLSGHYILFYKDQITVDLYSLFALLLTVLAIQEYEMRSRPLPLYGCVIVAVSIGWGYATLPTIGLWWAIRNVPSLVKCRGLSSLREVVRHASTISLMLGIGLSALFIAHNILAESMANDSPVLETSVVDSALRRLGFSSTAGDGNSTHQVDNHAIHWFDYFRQQTERMVMGFYPSYLHWRVEALLGGFYGQQRGALGSPGVWAVVALVVAAACVSISKCLSEHRVVVALLAFGGAGWLLPMKNLGWFHDYTAVVYLGLTIVSCCGALVLLPKKVTQLILPFAAVWLLKANLETKAMKDTWAVEVNSVTEDFQAIREKLPVGEPVFLPDGYRDLTDKTPPFAVGFYLPQNPLGTSSNSRYVVVNRPTWNRATLMTPDNKDVFLLKVPAGAIDDPN